MKAMMSQEGEVTVVHVSGRLDINQNHPFRQACLAEFARKKVVFNLSDLSFVGSTGIQSFFQIIEDLYQANSQKVRVVGLNQDFQRLVGLKSEFKIPCLPSVYEAKVSFEETHLAFSQETTEGALPKND